MSLPKFMQVAVIIRAQVADGILRPGESAPSAAALSRVTGYSTLTCRKALNALITDGVLVPGTSPGARPRVPARARVLVDYKVRIEEPKSHNGKRTLPLDDDLVAALVELRKRQARESAIAGTAYGAGLADLDWYSPGDKYVVTDQLGTPMHPESYSGEFTRLLKLAGLPKIRLHDSRHTTLSLMEKAGVPISVISKWTGHYDSSFTMKTYVHASDDDLKQGRQALAKIHRIV